MLILPQWLRCLPVLGFALLLIGCAPAAPDATETAEVTRAPFGENFESAECPVEFGFRYEVDCGFVTVPVRHAQPDGGTLKIAVARVRSFSDSPAPDAVIQLDGGPGVPSLLLAAGGVNSFLETYLLTRDVIVMDQRGMGFSEPALECPDLNAAHQNYSVSFEEALPALLAANQACIDALKGQGVDLEAFTTRENAADVADVVQALGYEQVNLNGTSYGSSLALAVVRDHPDIVRSLVIDAIVPPQTDLLVEMHAAYQDSLNRVSEACAADELCHEYFPDLKGLLYQTAAELDADPLILEIPPERGGLGTVVIDGTLFIEIVRQMLNRGQIGAVGSVMSSIRVRNDYAIEGMVVDLLRVPPLAGGAHYAISCHDNLWQTSREHAEATFSPFDEQLEAYAWIAWQRAEAICKQWSTEPPAPEEFEPVVSDIPALIISGEFDERTPSAFGALVAEGFANSTAIVLPGFGHTGKAASLCAVSIATAFIDDPSAAPDVTCVDEMLPIEYTVP